MSSKRAVLFIVASLLAASFLWGWYVLQDSTQPVFRPHDWSWDVVAESLQHDGREVAPGLIDDPHNPLLVIVSWIFEISGRTYTGLVGVQLLFVLILIVSTAALAWRLGGPFAGAVAAWMAALIHSTLGLAVWLDNLLLNQAMVAASLALLAWSGTRRYRFLGLLCPIPLCLAVASCAFTSTGILVLAVFGCAAVSLVVYQSINEYGSRVVELIRSLFSHRVYSYLGILIALVACPFLISQPIGVGFFFGEAVRSDFTDVSQNPATVLSYFAAWAVHQVGPAAAVLTAIASIFILIKKDARAVPMLIWLLVPMLALGFIAKRNDYYVNAAIPAACVILALGLADIKRTWIRYTSAVLCIFIMFFSWISTATDTSIEDRAFNPWNAFQEASRPYLVSTAQPVDDVIQNTRWIARFCGQKGLRVYYVTPELDHQYIYYLTWRADPLSDPGDWLRGPELKAQPVCLAMKIPMDSEPSESTADALDAIASSLSTHPLLFEAFYMPQVEQLKQTTSQYILQSHRRGWAIYTSN